MDNHLTKDRNFLSHGNIKNFNTGHLAINLLARATTLHNKGIYTSRFNFQQQQQHYEISS